MATERAGWTMTFDENAKIKENVDFALKNHFMGARLFMSTNMPGEAEVCFLLPDSGPSILGTDGIPPLSLSLEDSQGQKIFSGKASHIRRGAAGPGNTISITFRDPIYWELSDESYYAYPQGSISDIFKHLAKDTNVRVSVDSDLSIRLPSGGQSAKRFDVMCDVAARVGAFVFYDPRTTSLHVSKWAPKSAKKLDTKFLLGVTGSTFRAKSAVSTLVLSGRKDLKNDWFEQKVDAKHASVTPGQMGSILEAWRKSAPTSSKKTVMVSHLTQADAKELGANLLGAQIAQASKTTLRLQEKTLFPGDTISIDSFSDFEKGELLITQVDYCFNSAVPVGTVTGVRA